MAITVVLMESENAGNIGAIARAMKNFGAGKLVLLSPKADHRGKEASDRAKYAKDILTKAKVMTQEEFFRREKRKFVHVIATSAKPGSSYNMKRNPITPATLGQHLIKIPEKKDVALLFGREGIGLTNDEIAQCDLLVTIPASPEYGVLNVSAAATVLLAEIFAARASAGLERHTLEYIIAPTAREREQLVKLSHDAIGALAFRTPAKFQTQRIVWRKLFGKASLSRREAYALMGFFRKILERAKRAQKK